MSTVQAVLLFWVLFGGTHVAASGLPVRTRAIARLGLGGFKAVYSLVAFATFGPLCWFYLGDRHAGAYLFDPPGAARLLAEVLMLAALVVLGQALATPSPLTTQAELSGRYPAGARGIQRITRHPLNLAFGLFGLAHLLVNPFLGDLLFFGGFPLYGIVSARHQDGRVRATGPQEARRFLDETSAIPFAAILGGRQRWGLRELSLPALALSLAVFLVLRYAHGRLFGAPLV